MTNNREEQNNQKVKRKSLIVTLLNRLAYFIYSLFTETWIGRSVIGDGRLYDESAIGKLLSGENKSKEAKERRRKLGGALERGAAARTFRKLSATLSEISTWLPDTAPVIEKTCFSVFGSPEFNTFLSKRKREVLIFTGVEMHVCLLQSVLDARAAGYEVIVVADAVGSRKDSDRDLALEMARSAGAAVLSSESVLFMLMRDSGNPRFKAVSKLIK